MIFKYFSVTNPLSIFGTMLFIRDIQNLVKTVDFESRLFKAGISEFFGVTSHSGT